MASSRKVEQVRRARTEEKLPKLLQETRRATIIIGVVRNSRHLEVTHCPPTGQRTNDGGTVTQQGIVLQ